MHTMIDIDSHSSFTLTFNGVQIYLYLHSALALS